MHGKRIGVVAAVGLLVSSCSLFLDVGDLGDAGATEPLVGESSEAGALDRNASGNDGALIIESGIDSGIDSANDSGILFSDDADSTFDSTPAFAETGTELLRNPHVAFCGDAGTSIICEDFDVDGGWLPQWAVSGRPTVHVADGNSFFNALVEGSETDIPQQTISQTRAQSVESGDLHLAFKLRVLHMGGQRPDAATPAAIVARAGISHSSGVQREWRVVIHPEGANHRAVIEQKVTNADGGLTFKAFAPATVSSEAALWEDVEMIVRLRPSARDEIVLSVNGRNVSAYGEQPLAGTLLSIVRVGLTYVRPSSSAWEVDMDDVRLWFEPR